tara:strand:+ start:198 stop:311 length:114 start_codon:yes stop_codon:yes gene_type:complete
MGQSIPKNPSGNIKPDQTLIAESDIAQGEWRECGCGQ